eukprot:scaffold1009_cov375-Prasinococcus_capsulatus_cf.AAC.1
MDSSRKLKMESKTELPLPSPSSVDSAPRAASAASLAVGMSPELPGDVAQARKASSASFTCRTASSLLPPPEV